MVGELESWWKVETPLFDLVVEFSRDSWVREGS